MKRFALCYRTVICPVCDSGVLWPNGWMDQDATWYGDTPRPRQHCVRWGPSSPQRSTAPKFWPMSAVAKTAGWIKMPLGTEIYLSSGYIVFNDDLLCLQIPPQKGTQEPPHLSAHIYCDQTAGWIKTPLGTEVGLSPGQIVLDGDSASPPRKGYRSPTFRPISIVAKHGWMDEDTTWYGGRPRPRRRCV